MEEIKLKPCPFCGGEARIEIANVSSGIMTMYVACSNPECSAKIRFVDRSGDSVVVTVGEFLASVSKIVEKWNKRVGEDV